MDLFATLQESEPGLPPFREVNHSIKLIDLDKTYRTYTPRCADFLLEQLHTKIKDYVSAGKWEPRAVNNALPALCLWKPNGKLRVVVDKREINANTVKDVTPLPDQDLIRTMVACHPYISHIDLLDAYKQIQVETPDLLKTAFSTVNGTYISHVMQ
jgi:hypothetical protein